MPFERYLRADDYTTDNGSDLSCYYQDTRHYDDDASCHYQHPCFPDINLYDHPSPHSIQFQIPHYMLNGPPMLAPGGGAEVLPRLLEGGSDAFTSSWITNNGFSSFQSSSISKQPASGPSPSDSASPAPGHTFPPTAQDVPPSFLPQLTTSIDAHQQPLPEPVPISHRVPSTYGSDLTPSLPPVSSSNNASYALSNALALEHDPPLVVAAPSVAGLSVYSASGFDVLSLLSRVVNRSNPTIQLGPVDLSCSFVIVDVRRYDCPIVYASPSFCHLTGYNEQEILGRNCRFLQSPTGNVAKGEPRHFVSSEAVSHMRKQLSLSKECQTTLINYRKGGQIFINLVTVIPLLGGVHNAPEEANEVAYHIGFQVDLTDQPTRILDKLRDGTYHHYGIGPCLPGRVGQSPRIQATNIGFKGAKHGQTMSMVVSKELKNLLADTTFTDAVSITTGVNVTGATASGEQGGNTTAPLTVFVRPPSNAAASRSPAAGSNQVSLSPALSLLLLEVLPDFLLVLSLKGTFLYVAPSVRLTLGYESHELVGRSISDICHPADLVPLMRELKEGSINGLTVSSNSDPTTSTYPPRSVDLLFRALPRTLSKKEQKAPVDHADFYSSQSSSVPASSSDGISPPYVWLECRGRLHVEPGKGRKAIILSARERWMPVVRWGAITKAAGVGGLRKVADGSRMASDQPDPLEFWSLLSLQGTFLVTSTSVRDVLGWGNSEMIGRSLWAMVSDGRGCVREHLEAELMKVDSFEASNDPPPTILTTSLMHKELHVVPMRLVFYRSPRPPSYAAPSTYNGAAPAQAACINSACPLVCQATVLSDAEYESNDGSDSDFGFDPTPLRPPGPLGSRTSVGDARDEPLVHPPGASLFEELEAERGSSWQYELQQLKFANQRLREELHTLQSACAGRNSMASSSRMAGTGSTSTIECRQSCSPSSMAAIKASQQPLLSNVLVPYSSLTRATHSSSLSSIRLPNSLHEQDPPSCEWTSLAGANGQALKTLKRSWRSASGPLA